MTRYAEHDKNHLVSAYLMSSTMITVAFVQKKTLQTFCLTWRDELRLSHMRAKQDTVKYEEETVVKF